MLSLFIIFLLFRLLDLGFEDFVRVGSVKKIAKPVLPYSVHTTGSDDQELKELQTMLKSDLSTEERAYVPIFYTIDKVAFLYRCEVDGRLDSYDHVQYKATMNYCLEHRNTLLSFECLESNSNLCCTRE